MKRWHKKRVRYEVKNGITQPVLLERHVVREIVDRLWLQAGIKVWVINQPVGGKVKQNVPGIPDLMGWVPNYGLGLLKDVEPPTVKACFAVPLFIEVKRPGGVRSFAQERFIEEASQAGCIAFFATSWAEVVAVLDRYGIEVKKIDDFASTKAQKSTTIRGSPNEGF